MPSWPSRLLHTSQATNASQPTEAGPNCFTKDETEIDVPTPASSRHGVRASRNPSESPRQGRSHSHPLTTLFDQTKKVDGRHRNESNLSSLALKHNPIAKPIDVTSGKASSVSPKALKLKDQDKELIAGRCATCDSAVKWPKHLSVFRCTICLMVNDLQPMEDQSQRQLPKEHSGDPPQLSLTETDRIIDDCVLRHLRSCSNSEDSSPTPLQEDLVRDFRDAKGTNIAPRKLHATSRLRVKDDERQESSTHVPFLSSSLPVLQANLGTNLQVDALTPPSKSPQLSPLLGCKQPSGQEHQQGLVNESGSCASVFRPLEDYIINCFRTCDTLNNSFLSSRPSGAQHSLSEGTVTALHEYSQPPDLRRQREDTSELDAKTILLGDIAENGAWWSVKTQADPMYPYTQATGRSQATAPRVSSKSPRINWVELHRWYQAILTAGQDWRTKVQRCRGTPCKNLLTADIEVKLEAEFTESRKHLWKTLFKSTEVLLRRPGRPLKTLTDCRFLLLLLENPLLYSIRSRDFESEDDVRIKSHNLTAQLIGSTGGDQVSSRSGPNTSRSHIGVIKRLFGLMATLSPENHRHIVSWFTRYTRADFGRLVDLVGCFVTQRLMRQRQGSQGTQAQDSISVLVPEISRSGAGTPAQLHAALGPGTKPSSSKALDGRLTYGNDWQIKAAAKIMSLLFEANNSSAHRHHIVCEEQVPGAEGPTPGCQSMSGPVRHTADALINATDRVSLLRACKRQRQLPTNAFYNTLLDYCDLVADFETWENRRASFSFCQYPMFLSVWAKIRILEYDARRQMEVKARQAFFNSIINRHAVSQYLVLRVRRECLVEDSLRGVSEAVGSGQEDIKKGLRIAFQGEEGVDAGGLRKEWFLLLVREVFDPEYGLFVYDEESHYCYFNPNCFETSDQFFLIGVVLGLAIYNSTILDIALPPFAFRKLLASAPACTGLSTSLSRPTATLSLRDLAEYRPSLASGLQQLLDYNGDVEETFCRDFVAEVDRYGQPYQVPLCPNGEKRAVTNSNRAEFVELYIKYLLDTSVSRQFEPLKRGFFSVCGGNALSLFRPEEIELLVRGSDEPLDVAMLQAVAVYDGWKKDEQTGPETVIAWFWELFAGAAPSEQRALLSFITGSDRLPAMGATSLIIKLTCLGNDTQRFPMARTCFNMVGLYRYCSKEQLSSKLWTAVAESEGFGLK